MTFTTFFSESISKKHGISTFTASSEISFVSSGYQKFLEICDFHYFISKIMLKKTEISSFTTLRISVSIFRLCWLSKNHYNEISTGFRILQLYFIRSG